MERTGPPTEFEASAGCHTVAACVEHSVYRTTVYIVRPQAVALEDLKSLVVYTCGYAECVKLKMVCES